MALREIGARLTLQGEAEWNSQMKSANRELANLKAELVKSTSAFAGQANSVKALKEKQDILSRTYEQQKVKVAALRTALEDSAELYGENSAQADKLQRELYAAEAALAKTGRELGSTSDYLEEAENAADGCATSIDAFGKRAKEAEGNSKGLKGVITDLVPGMDRLLDSSKLTAAAIGGGLVAAGKKAFDYMMELVDSTEELRGSLAKLEASAGAAGLSVETELQEPLIELYRIADGDWDSAFEALQNLVQADYDSRLPEIIEQLAGAVIQFPDTLKIESLADSLQETLATRSATGQFGELLDRLGVGADNFNAALEKCNSTMAAQQLVAQTLAGAGLGEVAALYEDQNEAAIALSESEARLELAQAKLAQSAVPWKARLNEMKTSMTELAARYLEGQSHGMALSDQNRVLRQSMKAAADQGYETGVTFDELYEIMDRNGLGLDELKDAARENDMTMGEYINTLRSVGETAEEAAEGQDALSGSLEDGTAKAEEAAALLEQLKTQYDAIGTAIGNVVSGFTEFNNAEINSAQTAEGMISALDSQIEYLNNYQANLQTAVDAGLAPELVEQLSDGSVASAQYLAAIAGAGGDIQSTVATLNSKWGEVGEASAQLQEAIAANLPSYQATLREYEDAMGETVKNMNKYDEAYASGASTFRGFSNALTSKYSSAYSIGNALGQRVVDGYNDATVRIGGASISIDGSHEGGLSYVPWDGYVAELHRGEMVVPASEAARVRAGGSGQKNVTVNVTAQSMSQSEIYRLVNIVNAELGGR